MDRPLSLASPYSTGPVTPTTVASSPISPTPDPAPLHPGASGGGRPTRARRVSPATGGTTARDPALPPRPLAPDPATGRAVGGLSVGSSEWRPLVLQTVRVPPDLHDQLPPELFEQHDELLWELQGRRE